MLNQFRKLLLLIVLTSVLSSCASVGPSVIKTYDNTYERDKIAILRLKQKAKLRVTYCDNIPVPKSARYLLLEPGRHEIGFSTSGQTLLVTYWGNSKKYMEAEAGKTYILKSNVHFFSMETGSLPDVIDVTNDEKLHVSHIPLSSETISIEEGLVND